MKLLISASFVIAADAITRRLNEAAPPALERYVKEEARRAEGEWYSHVDRLTGESGRLRTRTYKTAKGTLRAKVGSDAKYARYLHGDGRRVLDATLTDPMRANVADRFGRALAEELR